MRPHGDEENGLNWDEVPITYNQLSTVLSEAVVGFSNIYGYGESKCKLLSKLLARPVHNLDDQIAPPPANSDINSAVPNHVTEIPLSAARPDMPFPYTIASCTTSGNCLMSHALMI